MLEKIFLRPLESADTLFGSNTMMSDAGRKDRLTFAAINSLIGLCWAAPAFCIAYFAAAAIWEFVVREGLNRLLITTLATRPKLSKSIFYGSLFFANLFYLTIFVEALLSGHPLGAIVVFLYSAMVIILAIAYMARESGVFIASTAPIALVCVAAPFYLHLDLVGLITVLALEALCVLGVFSSLQRHAQISAEAARESEARVKAEEQNAVKSQFLSTMTHELRTPLNAIIGYSEMMKETAQDESRSADLADHDRVIRAAHSLLTLINDVLDISKMEAGRMTLNAEPFSVSALVSEAAATAAPMIKANNNRFDVIAAPDLGEADTDSFRLNQCLLNLLSNAAKFTKQSGVLFSARRERSEMGDWLVFDVADGGIGISKEQMDRLFTPFVQADSKITRSYGGTGLGLAITQQIAALLGGSISVGSQLGRGAKFTLRIPAKLHSEHGAATAPAPTKGQPIALVIDDDAAMRDIATRQLSQVGFSVMCAADGETGANLAIVHMPNIILLDINLPDRSGWELLREMRSEERLSKTPIIVVSIEDEREKAMALGACDVLLKPIAKAKLVSTVLRYARLGGPLMSEAELRAAEDPAARLAS